MAWETSGRELLPRVGVFRSLWGAAGYKPQAVAGLGGGRGTDSGGPGRASRGAQHLDACGDVVDDADGLGVCEARQGVGDEVEFHLPGRLRPRLLPVDSFASRALQAAVLGRGEVP